MKQRGFSFIDKYNFSEEEISKVSTECFGPFLIEKLKEKFSLTPYSVSVDASTIGGDNIFALKVKYLEKEFHKDYNEEITKIQNKIVGIQSFKESSKSLDMLEIIKEKLLVNEDLRNNLKGIAHDHASVLTGEKNRLIVQLNNEKDFLFYLKDPCHGINLSISEVLDSLPSDLINFITSIHNHFGYPQRCATLRRIQEEKQLPIKKLKKYVKTRWLSLGISLERLVEIWESLKIYTSSKSDFRDKEEQDQLSSFSSFLTNDLFKFNIKYLAYVIGKVNYFNEIFQDQKLSIEKLKENISVCYRTMLRLVIPSEKVTNKNVSEFTS